MKFLALIASSLITAFSFAQASYFNKKFDPRGGADAGLSIVTIDTGYLVCSFTIHQTSNKSGICLLFLDEIGDTTYTKYYGDTSNYYYCGWAGSFRQKKQGGFYLGGSVTKTSGEKYGLLLSFNKNGDTLWTRKYGNGTDDYIFYHARQTVDSGFICAGIKTIGTNTQALLIKTDSIGNVQWERNYGGGGVEYGTMVLPTANGGYLLGGETETMPCSAGATDQWLVGTISSGIQQWQKCYGTIDDEGNALPGYEFPNGDFAFVGQWAFNSTNWFPFIARVENNGDTVWTKKIGPYGGSGFLRNMTVTNDEDILAVGKISTTNGPRGIMVRVSADGDSLWYRNYEYYSTFSVHELWDIDTAHGGGYVMCGTTNQSSVQDVWVIKVDEHGCLFDPDCWYNQLPESPWSLAGIGENENTSFSVYPNPNNGKFFVEDKTGSYSDLEIKIYNPLGEQLTSSFFNVAKTEIDLTPFSNGIYFITVSDEGGVLWKTKVIKE